LIKLLPATATATVLPQNAGLAVLMPFCGEADATAMAREFQKIDKSLRIANYLVGGSANIDEFWAHLLKP
jgi:hypothetical protein